MAAKQHKPKVRREYGNGSVYEYPVGSGKWFAQDRVDGKLVRRRARSEAAAKVKLGELKALKRQGIDIHSGTQSFESWLQSCFREWLLHKKPKPRTIEWRKGILARYIRPKLGGYRLCDLRPMHIQRFIDQVVDEIRAGGRYSGERTVKGCALLLDEACTLAFQRKLIPDNPYSGIRLPAYERKPIVPLTQQQLCDFLEAAAGRLDRRKPYTTSNGRVKRYPPIDSRLYLLWACYVVFGWRRGEGLGPRWDDFDRQLKTIRIERQIQRIDGQGERDKMTLQVGTTKTKHGVRTLPLPHRLYGLFCQLYDETKAAYGAKGLVWSGQGLIFTSIKGTPLWPDNIDQQFRTLCDAAGIPDTVTLHHLRHTLATNLDELFCPSALKQDILGHAKQTITEKYTHSRIDPMRRILQAIEDHVFNGSELRILFGS